MCVWALAAGARMSHCRSILERLFSPWRTQGMMNGAQITVPQFITHNLIPSTLGNIFGGAVLVRPPAAAVGAGEERNSPLATGDPSERRSVSLPPSSPADGTRLLVLTRRARHGQTLKMQTIVVRAEFVVGAPPTKE